MAETKESEGTAQAAAPAKQQTSQDRPERPQERRGGGGQRSSGPRGRGGYSRGGGRRYRGRPKVCYFCTNKDAEINYKGVDTLRRFVTDRGKIRPRRQTGTCARHQRRLSPAIKRARHLALLPFTAEYKE